MMSSTESSHQNRLAREKSPYLLQHAANPVDWYRWGEEGFAKARAENKPIFLSIGYSTCHWCHVMAYESFEDAEVGRLLNEYFVSIKVDREERPDIDGVYMQVCQMLTGSGGWPLTIMMTPEKKPFFAGMYFPKTSRFGRIGIVELVKQAGELWRQDPEKVLESANQITAALGQVQQDTRGDDLAVGVLEKAYQELAGRFDENYGGFGRAPKFPTPHNLNFLLRYGRRSGEGKAPAMVEKTLQEMRQGGIYDHVGFGFHRYSTDDKWRLPHFEKMLYDQALLAMAYLETYQVTHKEMYARTAREIFTYVLRDMTDAGGGFYSAEDADSEGVEGKFYLWTAEEINQVLGEEDGALITRVFSVEAGGNFSEEVGGEKTGGNILYGQKPIERLAAEENVSGEELRYRLEVAREKLFAIREKRVHPSKDDKVLTDWNGLMIVALAQGGRVLGEKSYTEAAIKSADFILHNMVDGAGRLQHRWRQGEASLPGHLDDYAFLVWGLLELYETTFEVRYLQKANNLNRDMLEYFWDEAAGGFYFTADDSEKLLVRRKDFYDGALPSGNSVALMNLLRLGRITMNTELEEKAAALVRAFSKQVNAMPSAYTHLMMGVDFAFGPALEIVVVGESGREDTEAMVQAISQAFIPNKVVLLRPGGYAESEIMILAPFIREQKGLDGKATAYICQDYSCLQPTTDVGKMLELLGAEK